MVSSRRKSYQAYCKRTLWPQKIKDHGIIFRAAYTFMAYIREYPPGSKQLHSHNSDKKFVHCIVHCTYVGVLFPVESKSLCSEMLNGLSITTLLF